MPRRHSKLDFKNILAHNTTDEVFEKYEIVETLGVGSMGAVAKVRIRPEKKIGSSACRGAFGLVGLFRKKPVATNTELTVGTERQDHFFALKRIILDRICQNLREELENEINILRRMDHHFIVKAHEVFSTKDQIFLVLELCDGGDLYTRLPYTERQAGRLVGKIFLHYVCRAST
jgi:serine/threonine protein kinase